MPLKSPVAWILFVWVFGTFAFFQQAAPDWNVNSRMALTFAIVERGTFRIDAYRDERRSPEFWSGDDCARHEGHFYSDKSPAMSFLGAPALFAVKTATRVSGARPSIRMQKYWTTALTASLFAGLTAMVFFGLLRHGGLDDSGAIWLTAAYAFGTLAAGYSSLFYAYSPALFFLLLGYAILRGAPGPAAGGIGSGGGDLNARRLFAAGVAVGAALFCEYVFGLAGVALGLYAGARLKLSRLWTLVWFALGAAIPLGILALYTWVCFDAPGLPYEHLVPSKFRDGMSEAMGVGAFRPAVAWLVTFHPYRGLFVFSPALLLALWGAIVGLRGGGAARVDGALALGLFAAYLAFNASYYMWWGGYTYGPRHMLAAIPFLALALGPLWRKGGRWPLALMILIGVGVALNMFAVTVRPNYPQALDHETLLRPTFNLPWESPVLRYGWRRFVDGAIQPNWGLSFGLSGTRTLAPLAALWIAAATALSVATRRSRPSKGTSNTGDASER